MIHSRQRALFDDLDNILVTFRIAMRYILCMTTPRTFEIIMPSALWLDPVCHDLSEERSDGSIGVTQVFLSHTKLSSHLLI